MTEDSTNNAKMLNDFTSENGYNKFRRFFFFPVFSSTASYFFAAVKIGILNVLLTHTQHAQQSFFVCFMIDNIINRFFFFLEK